MNKLQPMFCHVCGSPLVHGGVGYSEFEYSCGACLAAYHVEDGVATYLTPSFVGHGETPAVVNVDLLSDPKRVRHLGQEAL